MQFRSPPTSLINCVKCQTEYMATAKPSNADVETTDDTFECPADADHVAAVRFAKQPSRVSEIIDRKNAEIELLERMIVRMKATRDLLTARRDNAKNKCSICEVSWETEETDCVSASAFKCSNPSCAIYNVVKTA